jgi:hypothetical protein
MDLGPLLPIRGSNRTRAFTKEKPTRRKRH